MIIKLALILTVLLYAGCTSGSVTLPFTVIQKGVRSNGECYLRIKENSNSPEAVELYVYSSFDNCKYNIGDVIK